LSATDHRILAMGMLAHRSGCTGPKEVTLQKSSGQAGLCGHPWAGHRKQVQLFEGCWKDTPAVLSSNALPRLQYAIHWELSSLRMRTAMLSAEDDALCSHVRQLQ